MTSGADGWDRSTLRVSVPRASSRTSRRTDVTPSSMSARPIEVAVAPPPRITAVVKIRIRTLPDRCDRTGQVGVVPDPLTVVAEHDRVHGPREPRPVGEPVHETHRLALERHRQGQPAPGPVQPVEEVRQPAGRHPVRVVGPRESERCVARAVEHG